MEENNKDALSGMRKVDLNLCHRVYRGRYVRLTEDNDKLQAELLDAKAHIAELEAGRDSIDNEGLVAELKEARKCVATLQAAGAFFLAVLSARETPIALPLALLSFLILGAKRSESPSAITPGRTRPGPAGTQR